MFERKKFHWACTLINDTGKQAVHHVYVYWDPAKQWLAATALETARAEAYLINGKHYKGVSAALIEEEEELNV